MRRATPQGTESRHCGGILRQAGVSVEEFIAAG